MKNMMYYFVLFLFTNFLSCETTYSTDNSVESYNGYIAYSDSIKKKEMLLRKFIKSLDIVDLPYNEAKHNAEDYNSFENEKSDFILLFNDLPMVYLSKVVGVLPDTTTYFYVLRYEAGDDLYLALSTFDKKGNLVNNKPLTNLSCTYCDCDSCFVKTSINKNMHTTTVQSIMFKKNAITKIIKNYYQKGSIKGKEYYVKDSIDSQ